MKSTNQLFWGMGLLSGIGAIGSAHAIPVVNENAAENQYFTAYPDHADPLLFYVMPNSVALVNDGDGMPEFKYREFERGMFRKDYAILNLFLGFDFHSQTFQENLRDLLAHRPGSRYVLLPLKKSGVVLFQDAEEIGATRTRCENPGGRVEDRFGCSMTLNRYGMRVFRKSLSQENALMVKIEYTFQGAEKQPDGSFVPTERTFTTGGLLDMEELLRYPELTLNSSGRPIRFRSSPASSVWPSSE